MNKRPYLCVCVFMAFSLSLPAQNLVPNYSFEDTLKCITGPSQFEGHVADWTGISAGLCYFTPLCTETYCNVPSNWWGHQYAHTGKAYAGIYTYVSDTCKHCPAHNKNLRNYMQDSLAYSLKAFVKYYVVFYVCPADTSWFYCNNIGAYFSDSSLIYNDSVKSYLTPQVANNPLDNPLTIAKTWIKVSGSFVAAGGEKYIVIGTLRMTLLLI